MKFPGWCCGRGYIKDLVFQAVVNAEDHIVLFAAPPPPALTEHTSQRAVVCFCTSPSPSFPCPTSRAVPGGDVLAEEGGCVCGVGHEFNFFNVLKKTGCQFKAAFVTSIFNLAVIYEIP